jgi:hypothetical protein
MELIVVSVCIREIANKPHFVSHCNNAAFDTLRYKRLYSRPLFAAVLASVCACWQQLLDTGTNSASKGIIEDPPL